MQLPRDFNWHIPVTFIQVAMGAAFKPRSFFRQMENRGDVVTPLIFLLLVHLLPSLAALVAGIPFWPVAQNYAMTVLVALIYVGFIYTVGHHIMRNPLNMGGFLRLFSYGLGIKLVAVILPFMPAFHAALEVLIMLYSLFVIFMGLRYVAKFPFLKAIACLLISTVLMVLLMSLIYNFAMTTPGTA